MSLYSEVLAAGAEIRHQEADLHIEINEVNREILQRYPLEDGNKREFRDEVTGKMFWGIPFAYDPWWPNK